jgi:3-oxoacyl-[acyl-carrier-protein] synthase II
LEEIPVARAIERRRVVITGLGLVSPLGLGTEVNWQALMTGKSGVGPITRFEAAPFPSRIAGQVPDTFDPEDFFDKKDVKKADTFIQFAVAAAQFAMDDSGLTLTGEQGDRAGVIIGSGIGGLPLVESTYDTYLKRGPGRISPFFIPAFVPNMAAGQVSIRFGLKGPSSSPCTACTTGLHAVGDAFRQIQLGYADTMFAGGTEGHISAVGVGGFCSMRALSTRNDDPIGASRPWDRDRDGFVCGEGAGVLLLEELEQAQNRGAQIYAEIVGYGMTSDAYHISAPHPEGDGAARVMLASLDDAELEPEAILYINAHGTSTALGDQAEVKAIRRVFGDHADRLAVSSTKSSTGHMLGAAGGFETGVLALALKHQILPATLNLDNPGEGCDLDFVPHTPRPTTFEYGLTNSFGFGGTNGALILRRWGG